MGKVVVLVNVTLDGVMQAPGRPDEDRRDGFTHGGGAAPYAAMQYAGGAMADAPALLFGRRTYEDFYSVWPGRKDNPYTEVLNARQKYVASTTLSEPLAWQNSTLIRGDAVAGVAKLKREIDQGLLIMGSGVLIRSLMPDRLIDEFVVLIHPLVFGTGRRLFAEGTALSELQLVSSSATPTGVIVATYRPAAPKAAA